MAVFLRNSYKIIFLIIFKFVQIEAINANFTNNYYSEEEFNNQSLKVNSSSSEIIYSNFLSENETAIVVVNTEIISDSSEISSSESELDNNINYSKKIKEFEVDEEEGSHLNEEENLNFENETFSKHDSELGKNSSQEKTDKEDLKALAIGQLKQIFGLSEMEQLDSRLTSGPPPEFMVDLYNTITDSYGRTVYRNPYDAHIVRSFIERDNSLNDYFIFNISGLKESESVLEAELHLHRLPTSHDKLHPSLYLTPFYILSLYQILDPSRLDIPDLHLLLSVQYVPALGSGWQVFNVKKSVLEWINGSLPNYGFLISASSLSGEQVPVRFSRRGESQQQQSKQPILVLFNNDSSAPKIKYASTANKLIVNSNSDSEQDMDEENRPNSSLENPRFHHALLYKDSIRHPNSVSRFRSRRSKYHIPPLSSQNSSKPTLTECGRHDLFVNFELLGWSNLIISPKGYNAYYCDGFCSFPLKQLTKPMNHAIIQSIVKELNLAPEVKSPCCVPTSLLPISFLYYDDNDNVILKQFLDMVANSCGCH